MTYFLLLKNNIFQEKVNGAFIFLSLFSSIRKSSSKSNINFHCPLYATYATNQVIALFSPIPIIQEVELKIFENSFRKFWNVKNSKKYFMIYYFSNEIYMNCN